MKTATTQPTSHLVKATGAIELSEPAGSLTLTDRRLFNYLLASAYRGLVDGAHEHKVLLSAIRTFAADVRDGAEETDNRRLKESIKRLQRVIVEFNYLDSDRGAVWQSSPLLGTCSIAQKTGELIFTFTQEVALRLIEPALFSFISLRVSYQFTSKYGLILYEILKRYADRDATAPYWAVKTFELRDLLGCRDRLKDWKDFRRRAIDPALQEIAELAEFTADLDEMRQGGGRGGGKVVSVVFHIRRKEWAEAERAARELEKPKLQRQGEKAIKAEETAVALALRWLDGADATTRIKWAKEAERLGITLPQAASARENLARWVPAIASLIVKTERL